MCRWLAYSGPALLLEELLLKPENSLIRQSMAASKSIVPTNGDGFGLGWYGTRNRPGVYRDTLPAWNDANLHNLSEQIQSELFFAHVRASTGTSTSRENCHPFRCGNLLFMQNGQIGGYPSIRRDLEQKISSELFCERSGSTDSEALFLLACGNGLAGNVRDALQRTVAQVLALTTKANVGEPFRLTAAIADGKKIYALRYSSDRKSPTLFFASGGAIRIDDGQVAFTEGREAVLVLSEPLDGRIADWTEVPDGHILEASSGGGVKISSFEP